MNKQDLLDLLLEYSFELHRLGLKQLAADIAFICDWFVSPEWNNPIEIQTELDNPAKELVSEHLQPHPAGKETIDEYSDNCPIPYEDDNDLILPDFVKIVVSQVLGLTDSAASEIRDLCTEDDEIKTINELINIIEYNLDMLNGDSEPIEPPEIQEVYVHICGQQSYITAQLINNERIKYNGITESLSAFYAHGDRLMAKDIDDTHIEAISADGTLILTCFVDREFEVQS